MTDSMNPTPTPLASTAIATPRTDHVFAAYEMGDASMLDCRDVSRQLELKLAAFQPLLDKVEGERDALDRAVTLNRNNWRIDSEEKDAAITALRANLAAAKEERDTWKNEAFDTLEKAKVELAQLKADLAAKEADTRRIDLLQKMRDTEIANAAKRRDMSLQIFIGELSVRKAIDDATPALASRADKGGAK